MKYFDIFTCFIVWIAVLFFITLCWTGAEYIFEGVVHTSEIDAYVASILAVYIVRDINHFDRELMSKYAYGINQRKNQNWRISDAK